MSGVVVRETVPDDVFSRANELALIDIPPDDLLERLREGKIYIPTQAMRALQNFFRKENLVALSELALRRTAERVHADVQSARTGLGAQGVWATQECLLVCIGPSPTSAIVVRAAKRLSNSLHAELVAVHIENSTLGQFSDEGRATLHANLRLAERLGAEIVTITGDDIVANVLDYAQQRNVTKIVIGRSEALPHWWRISSSLVNRLIEDSGKIDVYVVRGTEGSQQESRVLARVKLVPPSAWWGSAAILAATCALAAVGEWLGLSEPNVIMTFLLGVVIVSFCFGRWPAIAMSVLSVILFDVLFTQPYYTVVVEDSQYIVTFLVILAVALTITTLSTRMKRQAELSRLRERRTEAPSTALAESLPVSSAVISWQPKRSVRSPTFSDATPQYCCLTTGNFAPSSTTQPILPPASLKRRLHNGCSIAASPRAAAPIRFRRRKRSIFHSFLRKERWACWQYDARPGTQAYQAGVRLAGRDGPARRTRPHAPLSLEGSLGTNQRSRNAVFAGVRRQSQKEAGAGTDAATVYPNRAGGRLSLR